MKLKKWELALMFALAVTFLCGAALSKDQDNLSEKLIRLHVVANSDSDADQALKLKVRDKILSDITVLLNGVTDRDEAVGLINAHMDEIVADSKQVVTSEGYDYNVTGKIAVEEFPTREYDTFSLPAGKYTSLRVVIGAGAGHNWWCVIFPPLCTTAATSDAQTLKILTDDQVKLITKDKPEYVLKFKSIELLDKLKAFLKI
ncbi:stage II sporulation protein R [Sporobacter termitidis DSM 10068]|uniref:Stage II sporulation protein R n=1 Tax=Sporobacter termitidis DSM 10068 TaxID=1123282 RepID=A0A1M5X5Y8_9FIRM|nr:stage II sporulation protein R [Sporobacter termitidis]SHH95221.1 stage II sporulation protein R [Sporobacter termitidis DSM 10068]